MPQEYKPTMSDLKVMQAAKERRRKEGIPTMSDLKAMQAVKDRRRKWVEQVRVNNPVERQIDEFLNTLERESKKLYDSSGFIDIPANKARAKELNAVSRLIYGIRDEIRGSAGTVPVQKIFKDIRAGLRANKGSVKKSGNQVTGQVSKGG